MGTNASIEPLRWDAQARALLVLDQRLLPDREVWLTCTTWQDVARAIQEMAVRGAPAIGIAAAYGVVLAAHSAEVQAALAGLAKTRPTAVNLFWALDRMAKLSSRCADSESEVKLLAEAREIHREDRAMCEAMGDFGATLLPLNARVLTHCNAGALATGGYGTALGVIRSAWREGRLSMVYADETRPYLQGARLTAWELHHDGVPVKVICDNMAASLMSQGRIDAVIVGTDRVAANGDIANKIGTLGVAVLCRHFGIPFYVAAHPSTIDLSTPSGAQIVIEQRSPLEVTHLGDRRLVPEGVGVENPSFDVTPVDLVTALITERGVLKPLNSDSLAKLLSQNEAHSQSV